MEYGGSTVLNCTELSTNGWCATSTYGYSGSYYDYRYCTGPEDWMPPDYLGKTSCGDEGCTTVTGEYCVDFNYGGVSYEGSCTIETESWCATSTNADGTYATWAYCGFGNSVAGDECTFPFSHGGGEFYSCTQHTENGWCATSVYANTLEPYTTKSCGAGDYLDWTDVLAEKLDYDALYGTGGQDFTVSGEQCVPMTYGGVYYEGCTDGTYQWCATSTYEDGSYQTYGYCGYGNSTGDQCAFPFMYNGAEYTTCTSPDSSGWCATSVYKHERTYYSYKYCNEAEQALGRSTVSYGSGTTVTGQDCVPMIYNNVYYTGCTEETTSGWCATETYEDGSYKSYAYCGYGDSVNGDNSPCVFPFKYNNIDYTTCTYASSSGWCATSIMEFDINDSDNYYTYKYCSEEEASALGNTEVAKGSGHTVTGEQCVPMIESGVKVMKCSYSWGADDPWCATSVTDSGSYSTWEYCGYGNMNEDECTFPMIYDGVTYNNSCVPEGHSWCATSVKEETQAYYTYRWCTFEDHYKLGRGAVGGYETYGSGTTVEGYTCVPGYIYQGHAYDKCTSNDRDGLCATQVNENDGLADWYYCGYGNPDENKCVKMYYNGEWYPNCTEQSTSGWCATSTYLDYSYSGWKYCEEADWAAPEVEVVCETCPTTVTGQTCVPFMYNGELIDTCTDDSTPWCATSVDSANNYVDWAYCGHGDSTGDECYFPFKTTDSSYGVWYDTCTDTDSSGWCATSTYSSGYYYSWKYCDAEEQALGRTSADFGAGTTVTGESCVPMVYGGVYYEKCTSEEYSWCATSVDSNQYYSTWAYCGYGDDGGDTCVYPFDYNGETYNDCADQDSASPWCATSVYELTLGYYSWKYCDASDLGEEETAWGSSLASNGCVFPFSYLGVTYLACTSVGGGGQEWCATSVDSSGNYQTWQYCEADAEAEGGSSGSDAETESASASSSGMRTMSNEDCVPMIYGGVYYDACTDDTYGWCATSTDSDLAYQTWGYCRLGDGENCYYPFKYAISSGNVHYDCIQRAEYGGYGWCATSTYTDGTYSGWKYCDAEDVELSNNSDGEATTVTGENCVPMTYGGVYYEGCTGEEEYSWCATSTYSEGGAYSSWGYCGTSGNGNCVFPFTDSSYPGVNYYTCAFYTDNTVGYCATATYKNTNLYYSQKVCDESEMALGYTDVKRGGGYTIDGDECVPMIYGGANYLACTSDTDDWSWCATSTSDAGTWATYQYCGYGSDANGTCVPMIYNGVYYEGCTEQSTSGWCATSAYENTKAYNTWKYCEESDWLATTDTASAESAAATSTDTTVTGQDCVPMIYGGVSYDGCTSTDQYGWCATSTNSDLSYSTWAYCGYGDSYGDDCYYPFYYNGVTYYECAGGDQLGVAWCATSVYQNYEYYSTKYCDEDDLAASSGSTSGEGESGAESASLGSGSGTGSGTGSGSGSGSGSGYGSGSGSSEEDSRAIRTVSGEDCQFPFIYKGEYYYECTTKDFGTIPWCATSVGSDYSVQDWNYCQASNSGSSDSTSSSSSGSGSSSESSESESKYYPYQYSFDICLTLYFNS